MEMSPAEDVDPCELFFSDYQEVGGRLLPGRIEVRHGDHFEYLFVCKQYQFQPERGEPADD